MHPAPPSPTVPADAPAPADHAATGRRRRRLVLPRTGWRIQRRKFYTRCGIPPARAELNLKRPLTWHMT